MTIEGGDEAKRGLLRWAWAAAIVGASLLFCSTADAQPRALKDWFANNGRSPQPMKAAAAGEGAWTQASPPECRRSSHVSTDTSYEDVALFSPNATSLWPGALVTANSVASGTLDLVRVARAPVQLFFTETGIVPGADAQKLQARIDTPDARRVSTFLYDVLSHDTISPTLTASYRHSFATSVASHAFELGVSAHYLSGELRSTLASETSESKTTAVLSVTQRFFTVAAVPPPTPESVFLGSVQLDVLKRELHRDNPSAASPLDIGIVNSVSYGRRFIAVISSTDVSSNAKAAISASVSGIVAGGSIDARLAEMAKAGTLEVKVFTLGASPASAQVFAGLDSPLERLKAINSVIATPLNLDDARHAQPISYKVNYLTDGHTMSMNVATEFDRFQKCALVRDAWPEGYGRPVAVIHTTTNDKDDDTRAWFTLSVNGQPLRSETFGTKFGNNDDNNGHQPRSFGLGGDLPPWTAGHAMTFEVCSQAADNDRWDFFAEVTIAMPPGREPFRWSGPQASLNSRGKRRVCASWQLPNLPPPRAKVEDRCDCGSISEGRQSVPTIVESWGAGAH